MSKLRLVSYGTDTEDEASPIKTQSPSKKDACIPSNPSASKTTNTNKQFHSPVVSSGTGLVRRNDSRSKQKQDTQTQLRNTPPNTCVESQTHAQSQQDPWHSSEPFQINDTSRVECFEAVRDSLDQDKLEQILISQGYLNPDFGNSLAQTQNTEPDLALERKISKFLELRSEGIYLNDRLVNTHAFRNPSIMRKLIEFLELDEIGSNFDKEKYNPHGFPESAFYKNLAIAQEKSPIIVKPFPTNPTEAIEFAKEGIKQFVSSTSIDENSTIQGGIAASKKRKSKWDQ
ncbi:SAP30-binding protein [Batrachochytrium dendrobatidis]|nr:SAP30-binding protein [Batrachochytrium dendrobatidis]KAK5668680.1 SAP30-binding protein [Batrachochytrium dendrobatidis]